MTTYHPCTTPRRDLSHLTDRELLDRLERLRRIRIALRLGEIDADEAGRLATAAGRGEKER